MGCGWHVDEREALPSYDTADSTRIGFATSICRSTRESFPDRYRGVDVNQEQRCRTKKKEFPDSANNIEHGI